MKLQSSQRFVSSSIPLSGFSCPIHSYFIDINHGKSILGLTDNIQFLCFYDGKHSSSMYRVLGTLENQNNNYDNHCPTHPWPRADARCSEYPAWLVRIAALAYLLVILSSQLQSASPLCIETFPVNSDTSITVIRGSPRVHLQPPAPQHSIPPTSTL